MGIRVTIIRVRVMIRFPAPFLTAPPRSLPQISPYISVTSQCRPLFRHSEMCFFHASSNILVRL